MTVEAKLVNSREVQARLRKLNPAQNEKIVSPALIESMLLTLRIAARNKIFPGGQAPPRKGQLTSRTGALRRSLTASFATDRSGLPRFIEGGSDLVYAAVHEFGIPPFPKRPFLKPALEDASKQFNRIILKHWERANQ